MVPISMPLWSAEGWSEKDTDDARKPRRGNPDPGLGTWETEFQSWGNHGKFVFWTHLLVTMGGLKYCK